MHSILKIAYELKELLNNDPRFKTLNEKEKAMEQSEEVMALSYNKDLKEAYLSDTLRHYPKGSPEVKHAHVELFRASEKLDSHPLVKEYYKAYKEVEKVLNEINDILLGDLKRKV